MSGPELFVVCPSCGSEVSPYVTECPYCGTRVRKRAPKLERGAPIPPKKPRLPPLRSGEIPGIGARPLGKPYATIVLVALSLLGLLIVTLVVEPLWDAGKYGQVAYTPFLYPNVWYQLAVVLPLGLFGWLLETRHGPLLVLALFLAFGIGASAAAIALGGSDVVAGAPGAALAMIAVWAVPDLQRMRRGNPYDGDLLGAAVMALVIAFMPLVVTDVKVGALEMADASSIASWIGALGGAAIGLLLSRTAAAR